MNYGPWGDRESDMTKHAHTQETNTPAKEVGVRQ